MSLNKIDYHDGEVVLEAAVAFPESAQPAPAVLIAHAWAGCGDVEGALAQRLSALGYVGVAIDMFGKGVRGDAAGDNTALIAPWLSDRGALRTRMAAAVAFARRLEGVDPARIAAIGYCFGGLCVLDLARSGAGRVAGVVSLHGMLDGNGLEADGPITAKVMVEHGWLDPFAPPEKVIAFADEMSARQADWQLHVHGRALHAFTNEGANSPAAGLAYDVDADRRSWESTVAFLHEVVGEGRRS